MTQLLRPHEVASKLGISLCTAQRLIARRELPVVEIGRLVRVPEDKLHLWIEQQTKLPPGMAWTRIKERR